MHCLFSCPWSTDVSPMYNLDCDPDFNSDSNPGSGLVAHIIDYQA